MTATARHARHGAVTVAARQAITMAGPCEPGDVLGVIAGDFAIVGQDLHAVASEVVERLLAGGGELVTIVGGTSDEPRPGLGARPRTSRSTTRMSTSWCTTVARSAIRSSCPSSEGRSSDPGGDRLITLESPIATVLGDQTTKRKRIVEGLGLETVGDLLRHFPRRYVKTGRADRRRRRSSVGQALTVVGEIVRAR